MHQESKLTERAEASCKNFHQKLVRNTKQAYRYFYGKSYFSDITESLYEGDILRHTLSIINNKLPNNLLKNSPAQKHSGKRKINLLRA